MNFSTLQGKVVTQYPSTFAAASSIKTSHANILTACRIKHRSLKGFYWRHITDPDVINNSLINIAEINNARNKPHCHNVVQNNPDGTLFREWSSVLEVEKTLKTKKWFIYKAIKNSALYDGFFWKLK
jgi:hypothetical protein